MADRWVMKTIARITPATASGSRSAHATRADQVASEKIRLAIEVAVNLLDHFVDHGAEAVVHPSTFFSMRIKQMFITRMMIGQLVLLALAPDPAALR